MNNYCETCDGEGVWGSFECPICEGKGSLPHCSHCDERVDEWDDLTEIDGDRLCADCVDDLSVCPTCGGCGERCPRCGNSGVDPQFARVLREIADETRADARLEDRWDD